MLVRERICGRQGTRRNSAALTGRSPCMARSSSARPAGAAGLACLVVFPTTTITAPPRPSSSLSPSFAEH
eukprot:scaffold147418_cov31-Tisochrysis_lutea.AAC.2